MIIIIITLLLMSIILGYWSYQGIILYDAKNDKKIEYKNAPWQWKFFEVWNYVANFFLGSLIGYYFILVRWPPLSKGGNLNIYDVIIFFIFSMCFLRWYPYLIKNFTEGINAIISRVLSK